jgi:hypothetical protein
MRTEPYSIDAQRLDVVELGDDTRYVTDTIAIAVHETCRPDLVDDGVAPPVGELLDHFRGSCVCCSRRNSGNEIEAETRAHLKKRLTSLQKNVEG